MKAEIIGIGTEILLGQIVNTNSAYLSRKLAELGIDVYYHTTAGDNPIRLCSTIMRALSRCDIVITTGGLGPTVDDVTLEAITKVAEKPLILQKEILHLIKEHFKSRHIKMPKNNIRQAYIPEGARWLRNDVGTAPGIIIEKDKKFIIALPGPPREMVPMFERYVYNFFKNISPKKFIILTRTIKTTGMAESQLHPKVKDLLKLSGDTTVGIYAHPSQVELKITSKAKNADLAKIKILKIEKTIQERIGNIIFGVDNETLESVVARLLKNKTLAIAESCTGGLLTNRLTDVPGISKNLMLSIIAYSNKAKVELLGIPEEMLKKSGAVSAHVAKAMAMSIKNLARTDIGIGITGIAGPTGGTKKKPVGLVYIALSAGTKTICKECHFVGERNIIKFRATQAALDILRQERLSSTSICA